MTTSAPSITVVIPMLDEADVILRCLAALAAQDEPPDEVLVIDNGSKDGSVELIRDAARDLRALPLQLLREGRRGPASARNRGIREARSDVVAFLDADCEAERDWIRELRAAFASDPALDVLGGIDARRTTATSPRDKVAALSWLPEPERLAFGAVTRKADWLAGRFVSTFNCAVRRELLLALDGFDETFRPAGEDIDLWMRALERGARIVAWHPRVRVSHVHGDLLAKTVHRAFFYGEAYAHLAKRHFAGRLVVRTDGAAAIDVPLGGATVMIWSIPSTICLLAVSAMLLARPSMLIVASGAVVALLIGAKRLGRRRRAADVRFAWREVPATLAWYAARLVLEQSGRLFGSIKHRLLCI